MVFAFPNKQVYASDSSYAVISDDSLKTLYSQWRSQLSSKGIIKWDSTFDCNRFAQSFAAFVQEKYFAVSFHAQSPAQAVAIGEAWYTPKGKGKHAVNVILLSTGFVFFEPQDGTFLILDREEYKSIELLKF